MISSFFWGGGRERVNQNNILNDKESRVSLKGPKKYGVIFNAPFDWFSRSLAFMTKVL